MATINKERTTTQLMDWATLNDTGSASPWLETDQVDISSDIRCMLHIDLCQDNTVAIADEPEVIVWGKSGATDEDWHEIVRLGGGTTPPGKIDIDGGMSAADSSMTTGDTTGCERHGQKVFIKHTTLVGSMINTMVDFSNNVGLWFLNDAVSDYTTTADLLCATGGTNAGINQWNVRVPEEFWAAKVSAHNRDADANYAFRVRYSKETDFTSA
jgi:hypothetical protein